MTDDPGNHEGGTSRHVIGCVIWAGIGVYRTASGGVPKSLGVLGYVFVEVSDRDIGFDKPGHAAETGWHSFERNGAIWDHTDDIAQTVVEAKIKFRSKVLDPDNEAGQHRAARRARHNG